MPQALDQDLTITQASQLMGCHPRTVQRMIYQGVLKAYRYGPASRLIRIRREDIDAIRIPVVPADLEDLEDLEDSISQDFAAPASPRRTRRR